MTVLVLGATGMLGHKLMQVLASRGEVVGTVQRRAKEYSDYPIMGRLHLLGGVQAETFDSVVRAVAAVRPAVVVNCIGIVKQVSAAKDPIASIAVNALFPHRLAQLCRATDARLIHVSTDCVFSGRKGNYLESDYPDAEDLYGRTKLLGEVAYEGCITLRTSMIGRELDTSHGLIEWFLARDGEHVQGYRRAVFSGLTTNALADTIARLISGHPQMYGIWHVASQPISKFDLLSLVQQVYGLSIQIDPDDALVCDRSLNAERFQRATGLVPPDWRDMIEQMYRDSEPYAEIRRTRAN